MDEQWSRLWVDLVGRVDGPLSLRLILQPAIATILAVRAGLVDARARRSSYFWTIVSDPSQRSYLIRSGVKDIAKVFSLALLFDVVYQYIVLRWVYPGEAILVAVTLAITPYVVIRGAVDRVMRWRSRRVPQE